MKPKAASYYKQNRLKQLRAFCYAAKTGSISRAADQLYLSQPSVSLQIQALERELNTMLFERRGPKIRLTPDGQALLEIALPMVEGMDSLRDTFAERCGDLNSGFLNIAAGESTILYILPKYLKQFSDQYPGVRIRLHNVTGADGMAMLRADEADFAVGSMLDMPDDVSYHPVFHFNPTLITPLDHPLANRDHVTLEDIAQYDLVFASSIPQYLGPGKVRIPAIQHSTQSYIGSWWLGGYQEIRGNRTGHVHRHGHLPGRCGQARKNSGKRIFSGKKLRRGHPQRKIYSGSSEKIH